jgi:hypothetical protein
MQMNRQEFLDWPSKAITLLGMSGVGKTTLASKLPRDSWFHFSGDYRIGTKYLEEPILDNVKRQAMKVDFLRDLLRSDSIYLANNITVNNLEPVSTFLGKLGSAKLDGLPIDEFKRRQKLHLNAETETMKDVAEFIGKAHSIYRYEHFINDAGGSICELRDPDALKVLTDCTLILYLRADPEMEQELIQRAASNPKPMYYQEDFLDQKLNEYLKQEGLESAGDMVPDRFSQWIFPLLVEHRKPLYQALADEHGYTVDASEAGQVQNEAEFLELIASALAQKA